MIQVRQNAEFKAQISARGDLNRRRRSTALKHLRAQVIIHSDRVSPPPSSSQFYKSSLLFFQLSIAHLVRAVSRIIHGDGVSLEQLGIQKCAALAVLGAAPPRRALLLHQGGRAGAPLDGAGHTFVLQVLRELYQLGRELPSRIRVSDTRTRTAVRPEQSELLIPLARLARGRLAITLALRVLHGGTLVVESEPSRHDLGRAVSGLEGHHASCDHYEACFFLNKISSNF